MRGLRQATVITLDRRGDRVFRSAVVFGRLSDEERGVLLGAVLGGDGGLARIDGAEGSRCREGWRELVGLGRAERQGVVRALTRAAMGGPDAGPRDDLPPWLTAANVSPGLRWRLIQLLTPTRGDGQADGSDGR